MSDTLEAEGWAVEIADAQKVKGLAPLACKTDKIDSMVLAVLSHRDLVPAIWHGEYKFYARGVGPVLELTASGGTDRVVLLKVKEAR